MAIQFTDFSRAPLIDSPWKNALENVLKGYQMAEEPARMKREATAKELANKLKDIEVEHKPKEYELSDKEKEYANALKAKALEHYEEKFAMERDLNKAKINKFNQTPSTVIKPNGKVANIAWVKQELEKPNLDPEYRASLIQALKDQQEHERTIIDRSKDIVEGNAFDKLPTNDKKQAVAVMKGMNVDPVEAVSYLRQKGHTPSTYAKEKGIDITKVVPNYAAGEQNIKDAQRIAAYADEIDVFEKNITEGLGPYQNKIGGYSFKQIADSLSGESPDKVAKALAARALSPELISLRLKIMGGNIGIEAIKELQDKSLGDLKIIKSLVDEKTFLKAQEYMNQWIREASQVRMNSLLGNSMMKKNNLKSIEGESTMGENPLGLKSSQGSKPSFDFNSYPVAGAK
jgi:hypothetical protein